MCAFLLICVRRHGANTAYLRAMAGGCFLQGLRRSSRELLSNSLVTCQVCAEAIGLRQISGIGGQMDFVRGANLSKGGRSIIALHSTTADGKHSKIVANLTEGAPVTTSRCDVNCIVTEYGVAQLRGKTLRERAQQLIAIAHPKFRKELAEEYEKRFGLKLEEPASEKAAV